MTAQHLWTYSYVLGFSHTESSVLEARKLRDYLLPGRQTRRTGFLAGVVGEAFGSSASKGTYLATQVMRSHVIRERSLGMTR